MSDDNKKAEWLRVYLQHKVSRLLLARYYHDHGVDGRIAQWVWGVVGFQDMPIYQDGFDKRLLLSEADRLGVVDLIYDESGRLGCCKLFVNGCEYYEQRVNQSVLVRPDKMMEYAIRKHEGTGQLDLLTGRAWFPDWSGREGLQPGGGTDGDMDV